MHPAVALAAVIGLPDGWRTEVIKAFVVPVAGVAPLDALAPRFEAVPSARDIGK
jgi:acetyl-CoA synthetase